MNNLSSTVPLSIIVISRNDLVGLQKTIESINSQSSINLEVVLVISEYNDKEVEEILQTLHSKIHIKVIKDECHNIPSACNLGLRKASGNKVFFLDGGDTFYAMDAVEQIVSAKTDIVIFDILLDFLDFGIERKPVKRGRFWSVPHLGIAVRNNDNLPSFDEQNNLSADKFWTNEIMQRAEDFTYLNQVLTVFNMEGLSGSIKYSTAWHHLMHVNTLSGIKLLIKWAMTTLSSQRTYYKLWAKLRGFKSYEY